MTLSGPLSFPPPPTSSRALILRKMEGAERGVREGGRELKDSAKMEISPGRKKKVMFVPPLPFLTPLR